jgi:hypothetical protein
VVWCRCIRFVVVRCWNTEQQYTVGDHLLVPARPFVYILGLGASHPKNILSKNKLKRHFQVPRVVPGGKGMQEQKAIETVLRRPGYYRSLKPVTFWGGTVDCKKLAALGLECF